MLDVPSVINEESSMGASSSFLSLQDSMHSLNDNDIQSQGSYR